MAGGEGAPGSLRLGELIGILSVAADIALGQPQESELRTCLLAVALASRAGLDDATRAEVFYASQLRFIGCTAHAHEVAETFGDEIAFRAKNVTLNNADAGAIVWEVIRSAGAGRPISGRLRVLASTLVSGKSANEMSFRSSCEVAREMVGRVGLGAGVRDALWCAFERYDGKGVPNGIRGEDIPIAMRVVHLATDVEAMLRSAGSEAARTLAADRRGKAYDPGLVDLYLAHAADLEGVLAVDSAWTAVLEIEPPPPVVLRGEALDEGLRVVADFVDLKSPFTAGHSRGVSELAAQAAALLALSGAEILDVRRAGWVHDIGRTAIPNTIWDKPGNLSGAELERVRMHPYFSERLLARVPGLASANEVAACHHECRDGSGYHRSLNSAMARPGAWVLAAADRYHAMTEDRAHRPALTPVVAAGELRRAVKAGHVEAAAAEAVLEAAGHRVKRRRPSHPAGLTTREVEVLRLVAQGATTKQIAQRLVISPKTADHHIQHIYTKIGCSTRGAAALFAMRHDLVDFRSDSPTFTAEPS